MFLNLSEDIKQFIFLLIQNEVEFLVCGGHAVCFHGFPRMTMDFDILILPSEKNAKLLMKSLDEFGFGGVEELREELFIERGTVFSLGVQPNQIDLLTSVSSQNEQEIFVHKVPGKLEDFDVHYISLDDLLRAKEEAGRLKDLLDIEELRKVNEKNN